MCEKESWGAIFATTEAHSTQRDQPPRMHGPGLWLYEQKEQRVTPVRMIGVNCILWWLRGNRARLLQTGYEILLERRLRKLPLQHVSQRYRPDHKLKTRRR